MNPKRIVLLTGKWDTAPMVYHFLHQNFHIEKAIIENPIPRKIFLKNRIKKLGWLTVGGQVLFQLLIAKPLNKISKGRINEIIDQYKLNPTAIQEQNIIHVPSVNSEEFLSQLKTLQPDLVVVHGTRIISKKILEAIHCPFVNIHAGITPRYRGSHGAYWALANDDAENCGVTVHLVDAGIDTGGILAQEKIPLSVKDNFSTYAYLQLGVGLGLLKESIQRIFDGTIETKKVELNSALWHHPTLWGYLYKRISRRIK